MRIAEILIALRKYRENPESSNVDRMMYNDETKELVIKFNNGRYYTYSEVEMSEFEDIRAGNAFTRTSGRSRWGSWDKNKFPSVGAAVYRYLVLTNKPYRRGGSLR